MAGVDGSDPNTTNSRHWGSLANSSVLFALGIL